MIVFDESVPRRISLLASTIVAILTALIVGSSCRSCQEEPAAHDADATGVGSPSRPCRPLEIPDAGAAGSAELQSASFIISSLRFGAVDEGLNLDCVNTPDSCRDSFCRDGPDDGGGGADNRLGMLASRISKMAGTDLQREMTRAIESGEHPLILRLIDATDLRNGRARSVELSFGLDADGERDDLYSGRGEVRLDSNGPSSRPSSFSPVSISDGVVTAGPTRDWMPLFWTRRQIAAVPVVSAYLRFRISEASPGDEAGEMRVEEGMLAGAITPARLSGAILDMDARTAKVIQRASPLVRALIRGQSDLDLVPAGPTEQECEGQADCQAGTSCRSGRCAEPEERFDALSFAVLFEATSVVVVPAVDAGDAP